MSKDFTEIETIEIEPILSDAELMSEISNYLQLKYLFKVNYDTEYIYIALTTGRLVIPFEELIEFIDENYEQYEELDFTVFDIVDTYVMTMITSALDNLTDSEFQNNSKKECKFCTKFVS